MTQIQVASLLRSQQPADRQVRDAQTAFTRSANRTRVLQHIRVDESIRATAFRNERFDACMARRRLIELTGLGTRSR
jgi:hypothetical protein